MEDQTTIKDRSPPALAGRAWCGRSNVTTNNQIGRRVTGQIHPGRRTRRRGGEPASDFHRPVGWTADACWSDHLCTVMRSSALTARRGTSPAHWCHMLPRWTDAVDGCCGSVGSATGQSGSEQRAGGMRCSTSVPGSAHVWAESVGNNNSYLRAFS